MSRRVPVWRFPARLIRVYLKVARTPTQQAPHYRIVFPVYPCIIQGADMKIVLRCVITSCLTGLLLGQSGLQVQCPRYSSERHQADLQAIESQRVFGRLTRNTIVRPGAAGAPFASANFVDDWIGRKIAASGITPAAPCLDAEFQRRIYIDLIGRVPQPQQADAFLRNTSPNKRQALIDQLLESNAYADHWAIWLEDQFQLTVLNRFLDTYSRNAFDSYIREFLRKDTSYADFASELLTAHGLTTEAPATAWIARNFPDGLPMQDFYDNFTDRITTVFLGAKTQCISCHNGRGHLEKINLFLTPKRRTHFWQMSAFLSRLIFGLLGDGNPFVVNLVDVDGGAYMSAVPSVLPGTRPPRTGGPYSPVYLYNGEQPKSGQWRQELARMITTDRQFARATVNYLWSRLFNRGIVDPPDNWDLARVDPANPPPGDWPLQVTHPELLEALTDYFIQSNYSFKSVIRLLAQSNTYQLSSRAPANWLQPNQMFFAKHIPRRLTAEELYDSMITATATETAMQVDGYPPLFYASQLPDPTEPQTNSGINLLLSQLGRGDRVLIDRQSTPSVMRILITMNDPQFVTRSQLGGTANASSRITQLAYSNLSEDEVIRQLFLATLTRPPTDAEVATLKTLRKGTRLEWLSDVQWILLNKVDFAFNY